MAGTGGDCQNGDQHAAHGPRPTTSVTLLLVGKIGNGKSATGNSILGREAFASRRSFRSVTLACQRESTTLESGRVVNVIDTPGLFDTGAVTKNVGKEIADYMGMAEDGIDAVLVVFSAVSRFSEEDATALKSVHASFGERMILTFTHGDEVGEDEFKDMLKDAPEYMMEMVRLCGRRVVLFDNRTKDALIQAGQRMKLFDHVDSIMIDHLGQPVSEQMHLNIKEERAGRVKVEEGEGQVEVEQEIKEHSEIRKSGAKNEVLKPWYIRTYENCVYAAELVWNKICDLWNKLVAIVKGPVETTKEEAEVMIVRTCYMVQRRLLSPRMMTNYYR